MEKGIIESIVNKRKENIRKTNDIINSISVLLQIVGYVNKK